MAETFPSAEIPVHVVRASALIRPLRVGEDWLVQRVLHLFALVSHQEASDGGVFQGGNCTEGFED